MAGSRVDGPFGRGEPEQIFVSYSHADNLVSPDAKSGLGFVSALVSHIDHVLSRQGPPKPRIWWDQRQIDKADVFPPMLTNAIKQSSLLLVVMSRNWMARPWCRTELQLFAEREDYRNHVVLVRANHVDWDDHPDQLKHIAGYDFFGLDDWREAGNERLFFNRGKVQHPEFYSHVDELGSILWRRAKTISTARVIIDPGSDGPGGKTDQPQETNLKETGPKENGRTIYLAKPAQDTVAVYRRIANDLARDGYKIVPPVDQDVPGDSVSSALKFIDDALLAAEASIHLVGAKRGVKLDEELDYLVPLQLDRAAKRPEQSRPGTLPFCRVIWAPKSPEEECVFSVDGFREPMNVLNGFHAYQKGDQVYGDVSSAFLASVKQFFEERRPPPPPSPPPPPEASSRIYVWYRQDDRVFARKVRRWLQDQKAETFLPGSDDDPQRHTLHLRNLAECDAVFLCWADATDVWAHMSARELRNWRNFGRKEAFSVRGLVLGPPPGESKCEDDLPSIPHEIDQYVDLSKDAEPDLEKLTTLLDRARPRQPS
jgi:hypothetical protein